MSAIAVPIIATAAGLGVFAAGAWVGFFARGWADREEIDTLNRLRTTGEHLISIEPPDGEALEPERPLWVHREARP